MPMAPAETAQFWGTDQAGVGNLAGFELSNHNYGFGRLQNTHEIPGPKEPTEFCHISILIQNYMRKESC